jgi:hypothetical protein
MAGEPRNQSTESAKVPRPRWQKPGRGPAHRHTAETSRRSCCLRWRKGSERRPTGPENAQRECALMPFGYCADKGS